MEGSLLLPAPRREGGDSPGGGGKSGLQFRTIQKVGAQPWLRGGGVLLTASERRFVPAHGAPPSRAGSAQADCGLCCHSLAQREATGRHRPSAPKGQKQRGLAA